MEHTLGVREKLSPLEKEEVLILVLVEHTLGVLDRANIRRVKSSLNPCFSGTYSRRGSKSSTGGVDLIVLILVLVEHTLGVWEILRRQTPRNVLILVLVEHTLGVKTCKERSGFDVS